MLRLSIEYLGFRIYLWSAFAKTTLKLGLIVHWVYICCNNRSTQSPTQFKYLYFTEAVLASTSITQTKPRTHCMGE